MVLLNSHSSESAKRRVAVCMSGGLDSSSVASLLVDKGRDVIGLTACLWETESCGNQADAAAHARKVSDFLGIPHYTLKLSKEFNQMVVEPFLKEYARGRTPSPCINCNQLIKFGLLMDYASNMGCSHVATGHYARVERHEGKWWLLKGVDEHKDQSYFLHRLTQEHLARALFPLGSWEKDNVTQYAQKRGLFSLCCHETNDLCFVANESNYASVLEQRFPEISRPGQVLDTNGRVLGEHRGFYHYTIGQRRGLGIASDKRLYVKSIDADSNTVVIGRRDDAMCHGCIVEDVNWIDQIPSDGYACTVRLRYMHRGVDSSIHFLPDGTIQGIFASPQFATAPGQAAVFYRQDKVIGGGWIKLSIF